MPNVLEFRSARLAFGRTLAVSDLSLDVREGEMFALLGPNGAGKTCVLKLASGLLAPVSGRVDSLGIISPRELGYCPQKCAVWDNLRVDEQVALVAGFYRVDDQDAKERSEALFRSFALEKERGKLARELSRGNRRKLNFVLSVIHDPSLLILDEPEAELDIESRIALADFIARTIEGGKKTVFLSTHQPAVAERLADRIAILKDGNLLACGSPSELTGDEASLEDAYLRLIGERQ